MEPNKSLQKDLFIPNKIMPCEEIIPDFYILKHLNGGVTQCTKCTVYIQFRIDTVDTNKDILQYHL